MSLYATIKQNARSALKNYWVAAIVVMLIPMLTGGLLSLFLALATTIITGNYLPEGSYQITATNWSELLTQIAPLKGMFLSLGILSFLFLIMVLLVLVPLVLGALYWYWQLVKGEPQPISGVFHFFETLARYRRAIWLEINLGVRQVFWSVVFFLLPMTLFCGTSFGLYHFYGGKPTSQVALLFTMGFTLIALLVLFVSVLYAAYQYKYLLSPYLVVDDDQIGITAAIKQSIQMTKGHRFSLLWFTLSFIGWFFLCIIPLVFCFVIPYYATSLSLYARYIIETKKREQPAGENMPPSPPNAEAPQELATAAVEAPTNAAIPPKEEEPLVPKEQLSQLLITLEPEEIIVGVSPTTPLATLARPTTVLPKEVASPEIIAMPPVAALGDSPETDSPVVVDVENHKPETRKPVNPVWGADSNLRETNLKEAFEQANKEFDRLERLADPSQSTPPTDSKDEKAAPNKKTFPGL